MHQAKVESQRALTLQTRKLLVGRLLVFLWSASAFQSRRLAPDPQSLIAASPELPYQATYLEAPTSHSRLGVRHGFLVTLGSSTG